VICALAGCSAHSRSAVPIDATAGLYDRAQLTYRIDAGRLNVPVAVARIEGQLVSYDSLPSLAATDHSLGTVSLYYPHPAGRAGVALAEVTIETMARSNSSSPLRPTTRGRWSRNRLLPSNWAGKTSYDAREVWQLDLSKAELDQVVSHLNAAGFFGKYASAPSMGVEVATDLDGRVVTKKWQPVPELDAIMLRVRQQGQLVAYHQSPSARQAQSLDLSSLVAYRHLDATTTEGLAATTGAPAAANGSPKSAAGQVGVAPSSLASEPRISRLPRVFSNSAR